MCVLLDADGCVRKRSSVRRSIHNRKMQGLSNTAHRQRQLPRLLVPRRHQLRNLRIHPTPTPTASATPTPTARPTATATPTPTPCQLDKPAVACATSASSNIAVNVTPGESGAPSGFVIEWMTLADFIANGNEWPDNSAAVCEASFLNSLAPNQTIEVVIGDDRLVDSYGVRSDCSGNPLLCDTAYVFRCRANETQSCDASSGVTPLPARCCRAIRGKIARIPKVTGRTIPTFGR